MAAEKLNPRPSPFLSPTIPYRFGPTRLGAPFSKVWQAPHFLAAASPFSTEAVCSSFSVGSGGAGRGFLAAGGRRFLHGDLVTRFCRADGSENRTGREAGDQQNNTGTQDSTENF